jgi:hypothetical protein
MRHFIFTSPVKYNGSVAISQKQKAARTLGRLGGLKGGKARAQALSPERRKEIARNAVAARWAKAGISSGAVVSNAAGAPEATDGAPGGRRFFESKTIDQLIAGQGVRPVSDIGVFTGTIPDEDLDEFLAEIYRER